MPIPKAFVSYSHDSVEHKKWVLDFATKLRRSGIDASLDQWDLRAGEDLPHFMEKNLIESEYVLMICTEKYVNKADAGTGGVGYEKMIITSDYLAKIDSNKIIPIIRQNGTRNVPIFLRSKMHIDFSDERIFEFSFDELIRTMLKVPLYEKPEIGKPAFIDEIPMSIKTAGDPTIKLMKILANDFENGDYWSTYFKTLERINISRFFFDDLLKECYEKGLISRGESGEIYILDGGKNYIIENKLYKSSK